MTLVEVATTDTFADRDRVLVETDDGRSIGVFHIEGEYFGVENRCLHRNGPVCLGDVDGELRSEWETPGVPETRRYDFDEPTITCPLHGWEYHLDTGDHVGDDSFSLRTYEVVVEDDRVLVDV